MGRKDDGDAPRAAETEDRRDDAATGASGARPPDGRQARADGRHRGTTPVPHVILATWNAHLNGNEMKVLMYLCRRTLGWHEERATVPIAEIAEGQRGSHGQVLDE